MPLCTLHLIRLQHDTEKSRKSPHAKRLQFLRHLLSTPLSSRIITACVVRRPVIVSNRIDPVYLNSTRWDLLLVIGPEENAPEATNHSASQQDAPIALNLTEHPQTKAYISAEYVLDVGIPSKLIQSYTERNQKLIKEAEKAQKPSDESLQAKPARTIAGYAPKTSQLLEMSDDLVDLIHELDQLANTDGLVDANGPVCQLNLLKFKTSKEDKERYHKYGQSFAGVAKEYGGAAKIVGLAVESPSKKEKPKWDEIALASYHSIRHFAAMAASEEYQTINRDYRLPSLDDTTIICTQEVDLSRLASQSKARM